MSYNYEQGQEVLFNVQGEGDSTIAGTGVINGVAISGIAVLGVTYIVTPTSFTGTVSIPNAEYPFKSFAIPEIYLKPVAKIVEGV